MRRRAWAAAGGKSPLLLSNYVHRPYIRSEPKTREPKKRIPATSISYNIPPKKYPQSGEPLHVSRYVSEYPFYVPAYSVSTVSKYMKYVSQFSIFVVSRFIFLVFTFSISLVSRYMILVSRYVIHCILIQI